MNYKLYWDVSTTSAHSGWGLLCDFSAARRMCERSRVCYELNMLLSGIDVITRSTTYVRPVAELSDLGKVTAYQLLFNLNYYWRPTFTTLGIIYVLEKTSYITPRSHSIALHYISCRWVGHRRYARCLFWYVVQIISNFILRREQVSLIVIEGASKASKVSPGRPERVRSCPVVTDFTDLAAFGFRRRSWMRINYLKQKRY